jgi:hypothetical protein
MLLVLNEAKSCARQFLRRKRTWKSAIAYSATTELESHLLCFLIIYFIFKNSKLLNMSSNSDSDEAVGKSEETSRNLTFVKLLKEYPIILSKSQVPSVQQQKTSAKVEFAKRWTKATGESITPGALIKKLHNLKSRTIQKSDMNKTGNRKVRLADWEILLLGLLKPDSNPSISKTPVIE